VANKKDLRLSNRPEVGTMIKYPEIKPVRRFYGVGKVDEGEIL
jgi:hypothetical protein